MEEEWERERDITSTAYPLKQKHQQAYCPLCKTKEMREGNIDAYCCQPDPIHAVQQRDVGGLLLAPTHTSVLKLPPVNTIQGDCSPPTFTLYKGFDYIKIRRATFSSCISDLQIFSNKVPLIVF